VKIGVLTTKLVSESASLPPLDAVDGAGVRVEEDDLGIEAKAPRRVIGPANPEPVALPGAEAGHISVPDEATAFGESSTRLGAMFVEQAYLHVFGVLGVNGEVDTVGVEGRPERVRRAW
jgi:hypothetical protein